MIMDKSTKRKEFQFFVMCAYQPAVNKGAVLEARGGEVGHRAAFQAEGKAYAKAQSMRSPACLWK